MCGFSAPSPRVDTEKNREGLMVISLRRLIDKPKVSNPGPRLADVAGTDINKVLPLLTS